MGLLHISVMQDLAIAFMIHQHTTQAYTVNPSGDPFSWIPQTHIQRAWPGHEVLKFYIPRYQKEVLGVECRGSVLTWLEVYQVYDV